MVGAVVWGGAKHNFGGWCGDITWWGAHFRKRNGNSSHVEVSQSLIQDSAIKLKKSSAICNTELSGAKALNSNSPGHTQLSLL